MVPTQGASHRSRVNKSNVSRLFGSQNRELQYIRLFFECIRMIQEPANLYHIIVILCCRRRWANKMREDLCHFLTATKVALSFLLYGLQIIVI